MGCRGGPARAARACLLAAGALGGSLLPRQGMPARHAARTGPARGCLARLGGCSGLVQDRVWFGVLGVVGGGFMPRPERGRAGLSFLRTLVVPPGWHLVDRPGLPRFP